MLTTSQAVFIVVYGAVAAATAQAQLPLPVSAGMATIDEANHAVHVTIANDGAKTATAWSLETTLIYADQSRYSLNTAQDFYQTLAHDDAGPRLLHPGKTRIVDIPWPSQTVPIAVEVQMVASVYEDRTAEGDPKRIDEVFARRVDDFNAVQEILSQLRGVVRQGVSNASLQRLEDGLRHAPFPRAGGSVRGLAIRNLELMLAAPSQQPDALAKSTAALVALLDRTASLADQHSKRR